MTINKNMTLGEVLDRYPESEAILMGFGMHCFSCPMSRMETLEDAAAVHDIDLDLLLEKLNEMSEEGVDAFGCCCDEDCDCGCMDDEECDCCDDEDE